MGVLLKAFLFLIPIGVGLLYHHISQPDPIPLVEDEYWGPKSRQGKNEDTSIKPFKIDIDQSILDDFKVRLERELKSDRLTPPLEDVESEYGFNSDFLKTVGHHWLNKYDWRAREKLLNRYPQFKTKIGGLDIHFLHVKPKVKAGVDTRTLLLLHGWPLSNLEFLKVIPLLLESKDSKYHYEFIIPSLPGFGFSKGASRKGLGTVEIANIFMRFMDRLGRKRFYTLSGDWGAVVATELSTLYPNRILGAYSTMCTCITRTMPFKMLLAYAFPSLFLSQDEIQFMHPLGELLSYYIKESGYFHLQATKPDTIGASLIHSPLGLAAYNLEKISVATNRTCISRRDGGLLEKFDLNELLDHIMISWFAGSSTTSARMYLEGVPYLTNAKHNLDNVPTNVPYACHYLPEEIIFFPKFVLEDKYTNIQRLILGSKGGHFAAFEEPELVAAEAISFFNSL